MVSFWHTLLPLGRSASLTYTIEFDLNLNVEMPRDFVRHLERGSTHYHERLQLQDLDRQLDLDSGLHVSILCAGMDDQLGLG